MNNSKGLSVGENDSNSQSFNSVVGGEEKGILTKRKRKADKTKKIMSSIVMAPKTNASPKISQK